MKKLLIILLPSFFLTPGINNIASHNTDLKTSNIINTKTNDLPTYKYYLYAEKMILELCWNTPLRPWTFEQVVNYMDAAMYGIDLDKDRNFAHDFNILINKKVNAFLNYLSWIMITDKNYLRIYLNYAYRFIPLYTMFPYMYNEILKNNKLPKWQKDNLDKIVGLLRANDYTFDTNNKPIHGVAEYFEKNMAQVGKYTILLDILSKLNINLMNINSQYESMGGTYYGFYLFYKQKSNISMVRYGASPFKKDNIVTYKKYG